MSSQVFLLRSVHTDTSPGFIYLFIYFFWQIQLFKAIYIIFNFNVYYSLIDRVVYKLKIMGSVYDIQTIQH